MGSSEKKISLVETLILLMTAGFADFIELIMAPFGGDNGFIDIPITLILIFWFTMRGARWAWVLAGSLVELIPFLTLLPIRTATVLYAIYLTNHNYKESERKQKGKIRRSAGKRIVGVLKT